jgi:hypothetical protein
MSTEPDKHEPGGCALLAVVIEHLARREMPLRAAGEAQGRLDPRAVEYRKHLIAALLARAHGVRSFRATRTEGKAATIHLGEESRSPSLYPHG